MNRTSLSLIPLIFALVACGAPNKDASSPIACEAYSFPDPPCHDDTGQNPNDPHVMINSRSLNVTPACVRASRSKAKQLTVHLTPVADNELKSARIIPKEGSTFPAGTNGTDKDKIIINIPKDLELGYHRYGFVVNDQCVDPRVHVEL